MSKRAEFSDCVALAVDQPHGDLTAAIIIFPKLVVGIVVYEQAIPAAVAGDLLASALLIVA